MLLALLVEFEMVRVGLVLLWATAVLLVAPLALGIALLAWLANMGHRRTRCT